MPRLPRPLSSLLAAAATALQWASGLLASGFGLLPLLRTPLSGHPPRQPGPTLSYPTAFLFRALVLYRWLRRTNFVGRDLAALYLRRATRELAGAAPSAAVPQPLPEHAASELTPEEFFERYLQRTHPVVIRGLHAMRRDWSLRALAAEFGDTELLFNEERGYRMRPLRHLLESEDPSLYVANCEQLLLRNPELLEALDLEQYRRWTRRFSYCAQVFLGARKSLGLYFHCANNVNMFTMLHGRKRWTFVDPQFSYLMYPIVAKSSAYVASVVNHREIPKDYLGLFPHCPRYEVVLEPGDVLFNPPWWWHQVENLDAETVGCASRWSGLSNPETNRLFSFAQLSSPDMLKATFLTLRDLLESGGDVNELYRRAAHDTDPTTIIEKVSHTSEAMERGAEVVRIYPAPGSERILPAPESGARR